MAWKGIGVVKTTHIWQIYYAVKYGVYLETLEQLDEYLEKKNRTTCIQTTETV
jgi:hypothetical protein